jgi:hypothetical protein
MTFVVILTFILCWTPYWVSMVIWAFNDSYFQSKYSFYYDNLVIIFCRRRKLELQLVPLGGSTGSRRDQPGTRIFCCASGSSMALILTWWS